MAPSISAQASLHVAERERVVQRAVAVEERARRVRIGEPAPHEHLGGDALQAELGGEPRAPRRGSTQGSSSVAGTQPI